MAYSNVQYPPDEALPDYRPAETLVDANALIEPGRESAAGANVMVVRSAAELSGELEELELSQPRWRGPIAVVLLLLCAEAFMASTSRLWKPAAAPRAFTPNLGAAALPGTGGATRE